MNAPFELPQLKQPATVELVRARPLLGTLVEVAATGVDSAQVQAAIDRAYTVVEKVHRLMSYHDVNSDVSRINRGAFAAEVQVDAHTYRVLRAARLMAETSSGVFDITIAPQLTRMGFLPSHENLPKISSRANWRDIVLLPDNRVRLACSLNIDLSCLHLI